MKDRYSEILKTSIIGIIANVLLVAAKAAIGWIANSISIILDAVNNLADAISSVVTIIGIKLAGKAPDKKHPFGYGRTEYISTLAISVIILYAGITAGIESVKGIIEPTKPEYNGVMLIILGIAAVVKVALGLFYRKKGKDTNSDSLKATGADSLFDSVISAATIVAAVIFLCFNVSLEAYLGAIISLIIIRSGVEILRETLSKILGEGASVELVKKIKQSIAAHDGVQGAYDLIFHNYGENVYVASVHIEVVDSMNANEIDVLIRHITDDIYKEFGVLLTAIGIYSHNTMDEDIIKMRENVSRIAVAYDNVHQVHGFYVNKNDKIMRFDMVFSFDEKDRRSLYNKVIDDLKKEYPEYEISAGMDSDFNEI